MNDPDSQDWHAYYERVHLFLRADALSIKVGLVLVPLLFGAGSIASFYFMPETLNLWLGISLLVAGFLLFFFILMYANRAKRKLPYALVGQLLKMTTYSTKMNESAKMLKIKVGKAYELTPNGKGDELIGLSGTEVNRILVLKHRQTESDLLEPSGETVFICVPNGQVVAYSKEGELAEKTY